MAMFSVPGDFPTIEKALGSPQVQRGDTVLVKDGAYTQVVVVPYNKVGVHVMRGGEPSEEPVGDQVIAPEEASQNYPAEEPADEMAVHRDAPREGITTSSVKVFRVDQGSPYWVTVHRSILERGPAKRSNPAFWMRLR